MGLALLANLAAYDFGYIGAGELIERTSRALASMQTMDRHLGHFYNWYDTQTLRPLTPLYISTVDSGNLAGHLLTLRAGLLALPDDKIVRARVFDGIADTLALLEDCGGPSGFRIGALLRLHRRASRETSQPSVDTAVSAPRGHRRRRNRACGRKRSSANATTRFERPPFVAPGRSRSHAARTRRARLQQAGSASRIQALEDWPSNAPALARAEYDFLFDKTRRLLAIGYQVEASRRDDSYYDLLASEARLCNFVAIAQGQLPQESWFALGRLLASAGGEPVLISWSGSMFEYLMPLLVMPTYENTLLDQTYQAAVERQIEYGKKRGVPWGISESGYNTIDVHLNYQYRAFGVPGLGLKRGLAEDLVIAPYASAMALMVAPEPACQNLQRLSEEHREGRYGFYEAIDYTESRLPRGETCAVVRSFMAHHQGMSLLSFAYALLDRPMQKRFEADLQFQATTLLLQERIPRATAFYSQAAEVSSLRTTATPSEPPFRVFTDPNSSVPEVQLLSNGRYHVMVTHAGGGYSRWKDLAVTRWREDTTRDPWGTFCYVRDTASGEFWSTAYQPTLDRPDRYEAIFSEARVQFRRRDGNFDTHTEIAVSPEDDIELRRVTVTNHALAREDHRDHQLRRSGTHVPRRRRLASRLQQSFRADRNPPAAPGDFVHAPPAFRRRTGPLDVSPDGHRGRRAAPRFPTKPTARNSSDAGTPCQHPRAMSEPGPLSNSSGSVLDPVVAVRYRITLAAGKSVTVNIVSGVGETRETCLGLLEKYQDPRLADRVFDLAWTHSQVALRQLNATESDAQLYERLAGSVLYANPSLRASPRDAPAKPPRPIRTLGPRHLRRSSHRAAANRGSRQYRSGAPDGPGPRLLAL